MRSGSLSVVELKGGSEFRLPDLGEALPFPGKDHSITLSNEIEEDKETSEELCIPALTRAILWRHPASRVRHLRPNVL